MQKLVDTHEIEVTAELAGSALAVQVGLDTVGSVVV